MALQAEDHKCDYSPFQLDFDSLIFNDHRSRSLSDKEDCRRGKGTW